MIDIVLWLPTLVWGAIFIWSYRREPRQFRNAFFFFFLCASALGALSAQLDQWWITLPIGLAVALAPFITIIFMLVNEVQLVRREGFSLSHALPLLFACAIVAWFLAVPLALVVQAPGLVLGFLSALDAMRGLVFPVVYRAAAIFVDCTAHCRVSVNMTSSLSTEPG